MFFLIAIAILVPPTIYVGWRLSLPLSDPRRRRLVWGAWLLVPIVMIVGPVSWALLGLDGAFGRALSWAAYLSMGAFSLILTFTFLRDLGWWSGKLARRLPPDEDRRRFLLGATNGGVLGSAAVLGAVGYREALSAATVVEVDIPCDGLPDALDGFTIAQVSDIHVGPTIGREYLRAIVDKVNALEPDLVAVTGDLVDGTVERLAADVAPIATFRSRHGTFFCTGNHEYYSGADAWIAHLKSIGLTVLENEHTLVEHDGARVLVAGVYDYRADSVHEQHRCDPAAACADAPDTDFRLLLAHQPKSVNLAKGQGYDLQLSGHTHGGQFFPWNFAIHLVENLVAGLYRRDDTWVYVNRGTGYWGPPVRLGPASEITKLRLVRA